METANSIEECKELYSKGEGILLPNNYEPLLEEFILVLPKQRPDLLFLKFKIQQEVGSTYRYFRVSRNNFLEWMRNQIRQLENLS